MKASVISDLAQRTGVREEDVQRVLDEVGFSRVLKELNQTVRPEALEALNAESMRISLRVGNLPIAV